MYLVLLLKITAALMLFGSVAINILILLSWAALGVLDGDWSFVPLWLILIALILGFAQFMISAFLFGVCRQVLTNSGADLKDLPLSDKLSETIDLGWSTSARAALLSLAATLILVTGSALVFFKDLVFLTGLHRGMQLSQEGNSTAAQIWFGKSVWAADSEREGLAHFLLAGSLIQGKEYAQAESEMLKALKQPSAQSDQTLRVFLYSGLASCEVLQNKLSAAEDAALKAVAIVDKNANLPAIELRIIGDYKLAMIDALPLTTTLRLLEEVYVREGKCDLAIATYERIFLKEQTDAKLTLKDFTEQLKHLHGLNQGPQDDHCSVDLQRVRQETKIFCLRKFGVTESDFIKAEGGK